MARLWRGSWQGQSSRFVKMTLICTRKVYIGTKVVVHITHSLSETEQNVWTVNNQLTNIQLDTGQTDRQMNIIILLTRASVTGQKLSNTRNQQSRYAMFFTAECNNYQDWITSFRSLLQKLSETDTVWIKECNFHKECISLCICTIFFLFVKLSYAMYSLYVIKHELQIFLWWCRKKLRQVNKDRLISLICVQVTSKYSKHPRWMDGTHPAIPRPH